MILPACLAETHCFLCLCIFSLWVSREFPHDKAATVTQYIANPTSRLPSMLLCVLITWIIKDNPFLTCFLCMCWFFKVPSTRIIWTGISGNVARLQSLCWSLHFYSDFLFSCAGLSKRAEKALVCAVPASCQYGGEMQIYSIVYQGIQCWPDEAQQMLGGQ